MIRLKNELANVKTVAIGGHIRPDGDCIGSCLGVWNYIQDNYPDIQADVYLEQIVPKFRFLKGADLVKTDCSEERNYDLFISLDASDREPAGRGREISGYGEAERVRRSSYYESGFRG